MASLDINLQITAQSKASIAEDLGASAKRGMNEAIKGITFNMIPPKEDIIQAFKEIAPITLPIKLLPPRSDEMESVFNMLPPKEEKFPLNDQTLFGGGSEAAMFAAYAKQNNALKNNERLLADMRKELTYGEILDFDKKINAMKVSQESWLKYLKGEHAKELNFEELNNSMTVEGFIKSLRAKQAAYNIFIQANKNITMQDSIFEIGEYQKRKLGYQTELEDMKKTAERLGLTGEKAGGFKEKYKAFMDKEVAGIRVGSIIKGIIGIEMTKAIFGELVDTENILTQAIARSGNTLEDSRKKTKEHMKNLSDVKGELLSIPFEKVNEMYASILQYVPGATEKTVKELTITMGKMQAAGLDLTEIGDEAKETFIRLASVSDNAGESMKKVAGALTLTDLKSAPQLMETILKQANKFGDAEWAEKAAISTGAFVRTMTQGFNMSGTAASTLAEKLLNLQIGDNSPLLSTLAAHGLNMKELQTTIKSGDYEGSFRKLANTAKEWGSVLQESPQYMAEFSKMTGLEITDVNKLIKGQGDFNQIYSESIKLASEKDRLDKASVAASQDLSSAWLTIKQSFQYVTEELLIQSGIYNGISDLMLGIANSDMLKLIVGLGIGTVGLVGLGMMISKIVQVVTTLKGGFGSIFGTRGSAINPMWVQMAGSNVLGGAGKLGGLGGLGGIGASITGILSTIALPAAALASAALVSKYNYNKAVKDLYGSTSIKTGFTNQRDSEARLEDMGRASSILKSGSTEELNKYVEELKIRAGSKDKETAKEGKELLEGIGGGETLSDVNATLGDILSGIKELNANSILSKLRNMNPYDFIENPSAARD